MEKEPKPFSESKAKEIMEAEGLEERSQAEQDDFEARREQRDHEEKIKSEKSAIYMEYNLPNNVEKYDILGYEIETIETMGPAIEDDEVGLHLRHYPFRVILPKELLVKEGIKVGDSISIKLEPLSIKKEEGIKYFRLDPKTGEKKYLDKRPDSETGK